MAIETIRTYEVQIKGANSVKELKKEISDLRDKLVQLDNTSDEYKKTVDDLIVDETKLKEVMSAGKNEVSAATGSYNALVNEMGALKKVWREVTTQAERDRIGARISEINEQLKTFDASIGNNQRKVGSYEEALKNVFLTPQQQLRKLRVELAGLKEGTEEYNRVFKQMTQLTHDVTEQQEMLRYSSADLGDIIGNLSGAASGLVGGFSALNAAMGLMGGESEEVQKAMLKTQQLMALVQGLGALENLGKRIKGLVEGIRGFIQGFSGGAAALGEFDKRTDEAAAGAAKATTTINTQSTSISQAAVATERMSKAVSEFLPLSEEEASRRRAENLALNEEIDKLRELIKLKRLEATEAAQRGDLDAATQSKKEIDSLEKQIELNEKKFRDNRRIIIDDIEGKARQIRESKKLTNSIESETKATNGLATAEKSAATGGKMAAAGTTLWAKSLGILKTAIIATGIGALIILLTSLVTKLFEYGKKLVQTIDGTKKWADATEELKTKNEELNRTIERQNEVMDYSVRIMEAQGRSYDEIYEEKKKLIQANLDLAKAELDEADAAWNSIPLKKRQKDKYADFKEELETLAETYVELYRQMNNLEQDKVIHDIEVQKKAEEDHKKAIEEAAKDAIKAREDERKKAEELYKQTVEYFKDEKQKLKEKYEQEKALLTAYGLSTIELTRKYEKEKTKIIADEMKARYEDIKKWNETQNNLINQNTLDYFESQLEDAISLQESLLNAPSARFDEKGRPYTILTEDLEKLNAEYGLSMKTVSDFGQQIDVATKAVNDAKMALDEFVSTNAMNKLANDTELVASVTDMSINRMSLKYDELASMSDKTIKGFYSGASLKDLQNYLDNVYKVQFDSINKQIELYKQALAEKNLTEEDAAEVTKQLSVLEIELSNLATQNIIDNNNIIIDSYNIMCDSIQNVTASLTDILGTVSDLIMDNAESAYDAGRISKEAYEEQFKTAKAFQISQAVINTIAGAVGAFMGITRDTGGWGIAAAIAEATSVLASGYAQIEKIKATQPNSTSNATSLSRYAIATPTVEDYSPQMVSNITNQQETEDLVNALTKTPLKAYVVESEVTSVQNKISQRNREATF